MTARSHFSPLACSTVALFLLAACGSPKMHEPPREPDTTPEPRKSASDVSVSSEVGGLNEDATAKIFQRAEPGFDRCFKSRAKHLELLSGTVKFFVIIGLNQKAKSVTIEESDLGDRDAEKCMQNVLLGMQWPKPVGGRTAHAHYTAASFEMPDSSVREAVPVDADSAKKAISKLRKAVASECQVGKPSPFQVTAYLDTEGKIITASASSPDPDAELSLDCVVGLVRSAEFPSPGSYAGKLTFSL